MGIGQTLIAIQSVKTIICLARRSVPVIFIMCAHHQSDWRARFGKHVDIAVELGGALQIGGKQFGAHAHHSGHRLASAGISFTVHFVGVDIVRVEQVFGQLDGLPGTRVVPIIKLWRGDDHVLVVLLRCKSEFLGFEIDANTLKVQALIAGKRDE